MNIIAKMIKIDPIPGFSLDRAWGMYLDRTSSDKTDARGMGPGLAVYVFRGLEGVDWSAYKGVCFADNWEESAEDMREVVERFGNKLGEDEARELLRECDPDLWTRFKQIRYNR